MGAYGIRAPRFIDRVNNLISAENLKIKDLLKEVRPLLMKEDGADKPQLLYDVRKNVSTAENKTPDLKQGNTELAQAYAMLSFLGKSTTKPASKDSVDIQVENHDRISQIIK